MDNSVLKILEELELQSHLEKTRQVSIEPQDRMLAITKETGELFNMILHIKKAKTVLEIGTSTGYSTIWCAEAIKNQSGKVITIEQNISKIKRAKDNFRKANLDNFITILEGTAMQILTELKLRKEHNRYFDFVLIDADKENIIEYFDLILPMVSIGGIIVTDNMMYPEKYQESMKKLSEHIKKHPNLKTITSPIGNGEEITLKMS